MPNFKPYNHDQSAMIVINFQDQLQSDTFEYTLHHLINDRLDLSMFYPSFKNDAGGRSAYAPPFFYALFCLPIPKALPPVGRYNGTEYQWGRSH